MRKKNNLDSLHWLLIGGFLIAVTYKKTVTIETTNPPVDWFQTLLNKLK